MDTFIEFYSKEERKRIDSEFRRLSEGIHYLDHAGAALYSEVQLRESYDRLAKNLYCNPHTNELTERQVDEVRERVLRFFNTNADEYDVVFTKGATESLKTVAETFDFQTTGHFMYLNNVHNSVVGMRAIVKTTNIHVVDVDKFLSLPYTENEPSSVYSLSNSLLVYPAQCNFNGFKYPLEVIDKFHNADLPKEFTSKSRNWYVCLDAANYVSTSHLDLDKYKPDFVVMSFYKIFGYPTGLGALLVSKRGQGVLKKVYHGGGTVDFALSGVEVHQKRNVFHERFEDGTLPFLSIVNLMSGMDTIQRLIPNAGGLNSMERISIHVFRLGKYLYDQLRSLHYSNGQPLIELYNQTQFEMDDKVLQSGIVTFNVRRYHGEMAGYKEIEALAEMNNCYLRVGCFCNPGACQFNLQLENREVLMMSAKGQSCNDSVDASGKQPFGFVRISVGYITRKSDVDAFLRVVREYFLGILTIPKAPSNKLQLLQMRIYPIRDGSPLIISSQWSLTERQQLKFDNQWAVVNQFGVILNAKNCPNLALIRVIINERKNMLRLIYPQKDHLDVSICPKKVENDKKMGFQGQTYFSDYGDTAAGWLSNVLEMDNVRFVNTEPRKNDQNIVPVDAYFTKSENNPLLRMVNVSSVLNYLSTFGIKAADPVVEEFFQICRPHFMVYGGQDLSEGMKLQIDGHFFKVQGRTIRNSCSARNSLTGATTSDAMRRIWRQNEAQIKFGVNVSLPENSAKSTIYCNAARNKEETVL